MSQSENVERTLRRLSTACSVPAAAALAASDAILWSGVSGETGAWLASPPTDSFLAALAAMLLVLISSAARGRILRRKETWEGDLEGEDGEEREAVEGVNKEGPQAEDAQQPEPERDV